MCTLALAYLRAGELPLAAETARKSMEVRSPDVDASAQFLMAMISWRRGEKVAALDWYIQALRQIYSASTTRPVRAVPSCRSGSSDRSIEELTRIRTAAGSARHPPSRASGNLQSDTRPENSRWFVATPPLACESHRITPSTGILSSANRAHLAPCCAVPENHCISTT